MKIELKLDQKNIEILMPETMELLRSNENKITKKKWWKCTTFRDYWSNIRNIEALLTMTTNKILDFFYICSKQITYHLLEVSRANF